MQGGYLGKILRVDLTTGKTTSEGLPGENVLRQYVGGVGLGMKMLSDEVSPKTQPLDPANRLYLMTGPLTGTPVPCPTSCCAVSLNADTGCTVGHAYTHGLFGSYLKFAGYDAIAIQGASTRPVYLWIHDGQAELRDAAEIWGKGTHATEELVRAQIGEPRASVACIGPAGENLIGGASINSDKYHMAAFGGMGAVMGSKKLKAIAAYGRGGVPLARPKEFLGIARQWWKKTTSAANAPYGTVMDGGITRNYATLGTASLVAAKNLLSADVGRDFAQGMVDGFKSVNVVGKPCLGCPIGCAYKVSVTHGARKGMVATLAGGGESFEGAAAMIAITDPIEAIRLIELYDDLGLNSVTIGCAIALAFEAYERGWLTKADTNGLELTWGNSEAAGKLLEMVVRREGLGKVLAEGPKKAAEAIGRGAEKCAVHVKGVGFRLHDYRGRWSAMLGQALAGGGPRGEGAKPDWGPPKFSMEGVSQSVRNCQMSEMFEDSIGVCVFSCRFAGSLDMESQALAAAIGWDPFSTEQMLLSGERIENLERVINMSRGLTAANDLDVGQRVMEPPTDGIAKGQSMAPYFKDAVSEYYRLMGWDDKTGRPSTETLRRLALEDVASRLWK